MIVNTSKTDGHALDLTLTMDEALTLAMMLRHEQKAKPFQLANGSGSAEAKTIEGMASLSGRMYEMAVGVEES